MTENIEFLTALHEVTSRSDNAVAFLEMLLDHPKTPEVLKASLAETQAILNVQSHLIRKLAEEQLGVQENLESLVEKINPTE